MLNSFIVLLSLAILTIYFKFSKSFRLTRNGIFQYKHDSVLHKSNVQVKSQYKRYNKYSNIIHYATINNEFSRNSTLINNIEKINLEDLENPSKNKFLIPVVIAVIIAGLTLATKTSGIDVNTFIEKSVNKVIEMGPYGYVYFAAVYIAAEILAIPAMPLTASSGYIFGLIPGTLIVLVSATIAASISFFIGKTLLRSWVQKIASGSAKWRAVDKAIEKEGFKVVLLLRLSPFLPFAISNYLYGITSVDYWSFILATFFGFSPGTFGIVYAGSAGKELFSGGANMPWYVYVAAGLGLLLLGQQIAKAANDAIKAIEQEDELKKQLDEKNKEK